MAQTTVRTGDRSTRKAERAGVEEVRAAASRLAGALVRLADEHEALMAIGERRRDAIRAADPRALESTLREEIDRIRRIAEADRERAEPAAWLSDRFGLPEDGKPRATWLAKRLPAELDSERLSIEMGADRLRSVLERLRETGRGDGLGVERLARHMEGLIRSATERLSHAGTYGRAGSVEAGRTVVSALDVST